MLKARPPTGSRMFGPTRTHECSRAAFLSLAAADMCGGITSFDKLAGRVTIVMNVAGLNNRTPQNINAFKEISQLYDECHQKGLEIIAFPSEQFGANRAVSTRSAYTGRDSTSCNFHVMQSVEVNGCQEHPVYAFLKGQGQDIKGHFQTAFIVACRGERCTIQRYDGRPPRALKTRVEDLLSDAAEEEQVASWTVAV